MNSFLPKVTAYFRNLNPREVALFSLIGLVLLYFLISPVLSKISETAEEQKRELAQVKQQLEALPQQLENYVTQLQTQKEIEQQFQSVKFADGSVATYIESVIKRYTGLTEIKNYSINKNGSIRDFGQNYRQHIYDITLRNLTEPEKLVNFIDQLIYGSKPLVLSRFQIDIKDYSNRTLEVKLRVNYFERKTAETNED